MIKRLVATVLWFLAGWTTTAVLAYALGLSGLLAPIGAVAVAAFVGLDPMGVLWPRRERLPASRPAEALARSGQ